MEWTLLSAPSERKPIDDVAVVETFRSSSRADVEYGSDTSVTARYVRTTVGGVTGNGIGPLPDRP